MKSVKTKCILIAKMTSDLYNPSDLAMDAVHTNSSYTNSRFFTMIIHLDKTVIYF